MATDDGVDERESPTGTDRSDGLLDWLLSGTTPVAFATDDRGRLTWWNDRLLASTGCDRERLDGLDAAELFATDPAEVRDRLCDVVEGTRRMALSVETADGRAIPHEFDGTVCPGPEEGAYLYVGRPGGESAAPGREGEASGVRTGAGVRSDDGAGTRSADRAGAAEEVGARSAVGAGIDDPSRYRRIVETVHDGVFTLDGGWNIVEANRSLASMLGHDREDLVGTHAAELIAPDGSVERAREAWTALQRGEVESGTVRLTVRRADGERFPAEVRYGRFPLPGGGVGAVGVVRDVTDREEREADLRRHRDRLARLNRIGDATAAAFDPVLEAGSREGIERRVCEHLADTDLYEVVWIGRPGGDGSVVPHTTSGADPTFHEVAERLIEGSNHERSADRAFRRGEPVVHHEGWEREVTDAVREAVDGADIRATIAIPLVYRGTTYGTLTAYSTRPDAFNGEEREALVRLGRAVGFAVSAVGTRRLVHAHERTELEFVLGPEASVLAALSAALDAECVLRWATPATGHAEGTRDTGTTTAVPSPHDLWLRTAIEGADAEAVLAAADEVDVVEARVVGETGSGCTVELRVAESIPGAVLNAGARPREVAADEGRARVVAEAPADVDIRSVVEAFTVATGAELVAKRSLGDPGERASLSASLTEKQREALRTAGTMGYFDWPREHTAEEVADRLGVASATLHYHLRAAQRTLVGEALDAVDDE